MIRLDLPPLTAAENLAADEVLLDSCEAGHSEETLIFWEPRQTFVVVGYANKVATEVNVAACAAQGVPIFRRCSGGGTIVQMPGGLNYSLLLRIEENGPTRNISAANQFIMAKNRAAIESLTVGRAVLCPPPLVNEGVQVCHDGAHGVTRPTISIRGYTDLCLNELKFAGNAQRRRKHFLLFHGTLLLNCDLTGISELLPMPSLQPDYRARRPHSDFVTNLNLPADPVKAALAKEWNATVESPRPPLAEIEKLAREKYSTDEWNFKF